MANFHINPETGNAGRCVATFKCEYGDIEKDHYPTAAEARKAYEKRMEDQAQAEEDARQTKAAKRLGEPIILPTLKPITGSGYVSTGLDYDYDRTYNHPEDEDICRCSVIEDVQIKGWSDDGEGLAEYARDRLGLGRDEPLPEGLKEDLAPFVTNFNSSDYEPEISGGYYGEEFSGIKGPQELEDVIEDHYYAQPDAGGPENILTYLRAKGYDTTGKRPLEAIKGALQAENNGKLIAKVDRARKWRTADINLSNIALPSESQRKAGEADPRALTGPYGRKAPSGDIAGVVLQKSDGSYELIDGYHRMGWLKANGKRRKKYLILSHEAYQEPSPWSRYRSSEPEWHRN